MTILLNIGLNTNDGETLTPHRVLRELRKADLWHTDCALVRSDTEETVVAVIPSSFGARERIEGLCTVLRQDCIAVMCGSKERGWLIGPRAHEWGEFDPTKFLLLDGSRLG